MAHSIGDAGRGERIIYRVELPLLPLDSMAVGAKHLLVLRLCISSRLQMLRPPWHRRCDRCRRSICILPLLPERHCSKCFAPTVCIARIARYGSVAEKLGP